VSAVADRPPFPFVVGCDRSGTTLVRALLDSHPDLAVPAESYFPLMLLRERTRFERAGGGVDLDALLDALQPLVRWQRWQLPDEEVRGAARAAPPADVPDAIRVLYRAFARHHGKVRYADKTPKFVFAIEPLAAAFPEAMFVHVVRDGRDIALSRADAGWRLRNIGTEALRWVTHVERGRRAGEQLAPGRYVELRYEDLVADPERTARWLCEVVGVSFHDAMLRYHERAAAVVTGVEHPGLHTNISRPPTAGLRDWRASMPPRDVRVYDAVAGPTLARFDYPTGTHRSRPVDRARAATARARWWVRRGEQRVAGAERGP